MKNKDQVELINPGTFEIENHYYSKVLNAQIHPFVSFLLNLETDRLINRYCHLNPQVSKEFLKEILFYQPKYLPWAGADLFHVTTEDGIRKMVVIETNSSPSGQKSMPLLNENQEQGGYKELIEKSFLPRLSKKKLPPGKLAVIYDKNYMEASGYAATIADLTGESVFLASFYNERKNKHIQFKNEVLQLKDGDGNWNPIRAAFRYVTQKPWNRIPVKTKTIIFNPILACLAGGRNKMLAAKAYELFNAEISGSGLKINTPETIKDVMKTEIPLWVRKFGGHAVIKNPYSNAGQGVYIITNDVELENFMAIEHNYDLFIVQSLIGNYNWSTVSNEGKFYHVGTVPNKRQNIFVADLRMMVFSTKDGFKPLAIYARRARNALKENLEKNIDSWDILGTNLSIKTNNGWDSDTHRLLLMDRKDFNSLGFGIDHLIEAFIQTVLSVTAIDKLAKNLINQKGQFRKKLFKSLDNDEVLFNEIMV